MVNESCLAAQISRGFLPSSVGRRIQALRSSCCSFWRCIQPWNWGSYGKFTTFEASASASFLYRVTRNENLIIVGTMLQFILSQAAWTISPKVWMSVPWVGMSTPNPETACHSLSSRLRSVHETECSTELKKCFPEFQVLQQEIEFFDTNVFVLVHVLVSADFKLLLHSLCILSLALRTILMSKICHKLLTQGLRHSIRIYLANDASTIWFEPDGKQTLLTSSKCRSEGKPLKAKS